KSKDSIPPLVDLVRELEAIHDGDFGASGTGGSQPGQPPGSNTPPPSQSKGYDDKQKRKLEVLPAAIAALRRITGQDFEKAVEWTGWWAKNAKTFKEPED
ncbi:MAG: hypothetical protein HYY16_05205, partial [Planctomycetes bacterium]|nr:hypothetical protein [Planctomycetota bacterium]